MHNSCWTCVQHTVTVWNDHSYTRAKTKPPLNALSITCYQGWPHVPGWIPWYIRNMDSLTYPNNNPLVNLVDVVSFWVQSTHKTNLHKMTVYGSHLTVLMLWVHIGWLNMSVKFQFEIPSDCWGNTKKLQGYFFPHTVWRHNWRKYLRWILEINIQQF